MAGTGNVIVQGPTGINTVTTWMSYTLPDNIQNLTVSGDGLYAAGNSLDNLITVGDSNNMQLYGAAGSNVLVGGAGSDTFIIDGSAGSNAIYNWHAGDHLRLLGANFASFAQVQAAMSQVGSDVVLHNGLNDLVIRNTTIAQFQASDFYIALDRSQLGQLTFDDEFNSLSLHSAANPGGTWTPSYWYSGLGAYTLSGNGELQLYTAPGFTGEGTTDLGLNPFSTSNGVLDIRAQTVSAVQSAAMWNYGYSSGVLTTHDSFAQTYGYFEMRAELPTDVSGAWPAFWLVPADGSWPPELDVMETLSGEPNIDHTTEHSSATGSHTAIGSANLVTDVSGFHTYGVLWTPTTLTWYLDGQEVFQTATPADMNKPMYMIANLAVGGWAGTPNFASTDMYVDYIRAYGLADGSSRWTSTVTPQAPAANLALNIASSSVLLSAAGSGPASPAHLALPSAVNGYVNAAHDVAGQTLSGLAPAASAVNVYDGTNLIGSATPDGSGGWSLALGVLADGAHSLSAVAVDSSGVSSPASAPLNFIVDTRPPAAPTALADSAVVNGYVVAAADTAAQALTGSAEAGALVTVFNGSTLTGSTTADAQGHWKLVLGHLADGAYAFTASASDAAGNAGAASASFAFMVDTVVAAPTVSNVLATANGATISGLTEAGATVAVFDNGKAIGSAIADAAGAWVFNASLTGSGVHGFTETALDAAGNSAASAGVALYSSKASTALAGGAGADILVGRNGDTLTGGSGSDHFVFNVGFGKETISDFRPGGDQIWIDHGLIPDFAHLLADAKQAGADVVITADHSDVLTLHNVSLPTLHSGDFLFF